MNLSSKNTMMDPFTFTYPKGSMGRTVYLPTFTIKNQLNVGKYDIHGPSGYMNVVDLDGKCT